MLGLPPKPRMVWCFSAGLTVMVALATGVERSAPLRVMCSLRGAENMSWWRMTSKSAGLGEDDGVVDEDLDGEMGVEDYGEGAGLAGEGAGVVVDEAAGSGIPEES